ncbi:MAG: hypothetical protein IPM55_04845 [Acidobacteria bacterium]|nr:hypothetical protein [Acidobacteriota bacterium]
MISQGTQTGIGIYLLKYSRDYEREADVLGAQIMARGRLRPAGYGRYVPDDSKRGWRKFDGRMAEQPS